VHANSSISRRALRKAMLAADCVNTVRADWVGRETSVVKKLQSVPLERVMAGRNDYAGVESAVDDRITHGRRHADVQEGDFAICSEKAGPGSQGKHLTTWSRIAREHDPAWAHECAKRLSKLGDKRRSKRIPDQAANARHADHQSHLVAPQREAAYGDAIE